MSAIVAIVIVAAAVLILSRSVRVVQQGNDGVVKRLGQFRAVHGPGLVFLTPFIDRMTRVDIREVPRTGDRQDVITKDNVGVAVNATIFSQVVEVKQALYEVSDYQVAVEQLARTALRAVFGSLTLDEALSERERINAELQRHMAPAAEKWGVRLNRIEIVDIVPPQQILNAMALQKEADQQKRAAILRSEGEQQAAINSARGQRQAAVEIAEGQKRSAILRAEGSRQAQELDGQGRAAAIAAVYDAIQSHHPTPELLAVLQLDALAQVAASPNSKVVVPVELAGLMGATQALRAVLSQVAGASPEPAAGSGTAAVAAAAPVPAAAATPARASGTGAGTRATRKR